MSWVYGWIAESRSRAVITVPNMASFWTLQVFFYKTSRSFGACVKRSSSDALLCLASALVTKFFLFKISGNFLYLITFLELHFAFLAPTFWCYCTLQITVLENQQKSYFHKSHKTRLISVFQSSLHLTHLTSVHIPNSLHLTDLTSIFHSSLHLTLMFKS